MKQADESIKSITIIHVMKEGKSDAEYKTDVIADDGKTKTVLVMFDEIPRRVRIYEKRRIRLKKVVLTTPNTLIVKYEYID